jgi:hypothetical protein
VSDYVSWPQVLQTRCDALDSSVPASQKLVLAI